MPTPSKTLSLCALATTSGVAIASFITVPQMQIWGMLVLGCVGTTAAGFFKKPAAVVAGLLLLCLSLGAARMQLARTEASHDPLRAYNDNGQTVTFAGTIAEDPDVRQKTQLLTVRADGLGSTTLVTASRQATYHYAERLSVSGQLQTPQNFDGFNYRDYLMKDGIYSVMHFPNITRIGAAEGVRNPVTLLRQGLIAVKRRMIAAIGENFSPPEDALVAGMLLAANGGVPETLRVALQESGMRWLTAVAGLHVMVIAWLAAMLLLWLGVARGRACLASVAFLWAYVALAGFPASSVRAGIMGSALLLSQWLGRQHAGLRLLALAAALMLLQNPLLLRYDAGFQLSFLASLGILLVSPLIERLLALPELSTLPAAGVAALKTARFFWAAFLVTLAVQLFTLPPLVYNFGGVAWVSPLANLLITPVVPVLLSSAFLGAVAGIVSPFFGWMFFLPARALVDYLLFVVRAVRHPLVSVPLNEWVWAAFFLYYLALGAAVFLLRRKLRPEFA